MAKLFYNYYIVDDRKFYLMLNYFDIAFCFLLSFMIILFSLKFVMKMFLILVYLSFMAFSVYC